MGINLWSYWGSWPPGWEPITKLGNFIKCAEVCGCDVTGSIIWIPLMFSRCCSGRREINTRRKNTFTSKEYEGGLDLPSYLSRSFSPSTSSLSRRSFVFYAPVTPLKTLQNTSWQTSPVSRGGRGRQVREEEDGEKKKRNLIIHLRVIVKRVALLAVAAGCPNLSVRIFLQLEHKRVSEVQKRCQVLKHVTSVHEY